MLLTNANNQDLPDGAGEALRLLRDKNNYPDLRYWVRQLIEVGWSQAAVARALEIHRSSVRSLLTTGAVPPHPPGARTALVPLPEGPVKGLTLRIKAWTYPPHATKLDLWTSSRRAGLDFVQESRLGRLQAQATSVRRNTPDGALSRVASDELTELINDLYYRFVSIDTLALKLGVTERTVRNRLPNNPRRLPSRDLKHTPGESGYVLVWPNETRRVWSYISHGHWGSRPVVFDPRLFEISAANPSRVHAVAVKGLGPELGWEKLALSEYPTPVTRLIL